MMKGPGSRMPGPSGVVVEATACRSTKGSSPVPTKGSTMSIPEKSPAVKGELTVPSVAGMSCREAAHAYLDAGLMPHPWRSASKGGSRTKISCYSKFEFHTIQETHDSIDRWKHNWQVGLVLSMSSGLIAGDIDDLPTFEAWDFTEWPSTAMAHTGREGGLHLLYDARRLPNDKWPVQGNMPGGQVKSNGFIGVEPSIHPNGRPYLWGKRRRLARIGALGPALWEFRSRPTVIGESGYSQDATGLWLNIMGAPDGAQRDAIWKWSLNAHDRGLSDEEIVNQLELGVLKGEIASHRSRDPWNRAGLKSAAIPTAGWRHKPRTVSVSVADGATLSVEPPAEEKKFWGSHDVLKHILRWSRARRVSPWAVLGEAMAEVVCHCPPSLQLPPTVGGNGSLNMLIALTGKSGAGKDAAEAVCDAAFRWNGVLGFVGDVVPRVPLGSGEGLAKSFGYMRRDDEGGMSLVVSEPSVIITVNEIDTLAAVSGRSGSTLTPQLRHLYNGQALGFGYADVSKRVIIPKHSYRSCLIAGVQPGRGAIILGDVEGGFAQRWLWLPAHDPYAPAVVDKRVGDVMSWSPPDLDYSGVCVMPVCEEVSDTTDEVRFATLRGVNGDMDSHTHYTRIKVAAALALLFGRASIDADVWSLSAYVMKVSGACRDSVSAVLAAGAVGRAREEGVLRGVSAAAAKESELGSRIERNLLGKLEEMGRNEWIGFNKLRMKIAARDREAVPGVLSGLVSRGLVETRTHTYHGQSGVQYRISRGVR